MPHCFPGRAGRMCYPQLPRSRACSQHFMEPGRGRTPIIPTLGGCRQENQEFNTILDYRVSLKPVWATGDFREGAWGVQEEGREGMLGTISVLHKDASMEEQQSPGV